MNIFFVTLVIFVLVYLLLNWFAKTSSKKISKGIRSIIIILAAILALVMVYAGRFIFSLPFVLMILPLIKTKAGLSLFQLLRIWSLLRILKNSGRFNFNKFKNTKGSVVQTVMNHIDVIIHHKNINDINLFVRRSFSNHLWSWMNDSARFL